MGFEFECAWILFIYDYYYHFTLWLYIVAFLYAVLMDCVFDRDGGCITPSRRKNERRAPIFFSSDLVKWENEMGTSSSGLTTEVVGMAGGLYSTIT